MSAEGDAGAAFVDGWIITQILGEGTFGEVRLLMHPSSGEEVAVKVIDLSQDTNDATKREIMILKMLKHENIIGFIGTRVDGMKQYIFLEYAAGGELFDRIEPDVGVPEEQAQYYFHQLISGVEYIHGVGVAHRDLKPENLLLTEADVLKISDFGLATIFRLKGVERKLTKRCGTLPYVAPEVLQREYDAPPADVWSCGVILVALLTGELPWDSPTSDCAGYIDWKECRSWRQPPWTKIHNVALSLLRSMLHCQPSKRATVDRVKAHQWFTKDFNQKARMTVNNPLTKRLCVNIDLYDGNSHFAYASQPEAILSNMRMVGAASSTSVHLAVPDHVTASNATINKEQRVPFAIANDNRPCVFSFSQPACLENLLISTQSQPSQQSQQNMLQKLVRRMTRFVIREPLSEALPKVEETCRVALKFIVKSTTPAHLTISTTDSRRAPLVFKAIAYDMNGNTLLDFRLSKGDGLEFKRIFIQIRMLLLDNIDNEALNSWTVSAKPTAL